LQDTLDMKDNMLLKASGGLTGGIGGQNDTCGALIGGCLMLGAVCGLGREDEGMEKMIASIIQSGQFYKWFKDKFGSTSCREMLTRFGDGVFYDLHNPEEAEQAKKVMEKCDPVLAEAAAKAAEMVLDIQESDTNK
jgi:C_GCAxxG_C_C family probable redox protein